MKKGVLEMRTPFASLGELRKPELDASAGTYQGVVDDEDDDGAYDSDQDAVKIDTCNTHVTESVKEPAAYDRADDSQHDVHDHAFAAFVDDLAGDETRD